MQTVEKWANLVTTKVLFNTQGTKFKTLGLDKNMSDEQKITWLADEPMLFKRPVIECDDGTVIVGFDNDLFSRIWSIRDGKKQ